MRKLTISWSRPTSASTFAGILGRKSSTTTKATTTTTEAPVEVCAPENEHALTNHNTVDLFLQILV